MENNFQVGDKAYYPVRGVTKVVGVESKQIGGVDTSVYLLNIIDTGIKIMVPVANVETVGLRKLIAGEDIEEVFNILRCEAVAHDTQTWNRRHREYMEKIKTGSAFEVAEVLRDLCLLRKNKDLSFSERKMLETARVLLVREIAQSEESSEDDVQQVIDSIFSEAA